MASFREVLTASDAQLVKLFYRLRASPDQDFIKQINHGAAQLGLNHSQLVCALGFNKNIRELTDILSVVGFASYKLLTYRRNELFVTDTYKQLPVDNVVDIYAEHIEDPDILATLHELLIPRLANIEKLLVGTAEPTLAMSYKMEMHSVYVGGIATPEFVVQRVSSPIGDLRALIDEVQMIVNSGIVPAGNLFFSDFLTPTEKRYLIEHGQIEPAMIQNRLANTAISEDERQMLEDFA